MHVNRSAELSLMELGGRIKAMREAMRITAYQACRKSGLTRTQLAAIENGSYRAALSDYLAAILAIGIPFSMDSFIPLDDPLLVMRREAGA